jgi:hypothetical protein
VGFWNSLKGKQNYHRKDRGRQFTHDPESICKGTLSWVKNMMTFPALKAKLDPQNKHKWTLRDKKHEPHKQGALRFGFHSYSRNINLLSHEPHELLLRQH